MACWRSSMQIPLARSQAAPQLRQICGYLHHDGLAYGLLYTDECFWFLRYIDGILYISKGAFVTQQRPTVIALLLYVGELARQAAASSMVLQRQPGIVLAFHGTLLRPRSADSEQSMPAHHELQMGSILASGSTGTVRTGLVGDLEVAVKLPEVAVDRFAACRRLEAELGIYQDTLLRLQGSCIPRVVASGTVPAASGARLPFFAVDLLPYSLVHMLGALNDALEQSVLHSLQRIHERGVLHGDLSPDHVRFSSRELVASSPQPRWVDFSQARRGASCVELAAERDECRRMLRRLRAPMLLSAVVMQQRMIPLMHERVGIQRLRFV
ncbi:hypothetical protein COCOBI_14-0420 [Coccomyxa sp. Obi]|nr:hypothetical protein COCOBI_14-0420 [Coccomyxa sp. Obi]